MILLDLNFYIIINFSLKEKRNNNIQILLEWLNFLGCKIPVIVYCINNFAFLQKLKVSTSYKYISFTDNLRSIEKFVEEADEVYINDKDNDELKIEKVNSFILYRINYVIVNKKINNTNKKEKKKDISDDEDEKKKLLDNNDDNNKKEPEKLNLNLNIEDNEMGNDEDNKENRKNNTSLISKSSSNSDSSSSISDKE